MSRPQSEPPREPLVPADVDLRDFRFTPMFRARLFGSEFHAAATDAEWRAGVTLWLKSWDQVPAGTLPPDDVGLCRLAEFGRDLAAWRTVKARALHGWHLCTDGRLHHAVVAEGVLEAWEKRNKNKARAVLGAAARWGGSNAKGNGASNASAMRQAMRPDANRQGQGQRRKGNSSSVAKATGAVAPSDPNTDAKTWCFQIGRAWLEEHGVKKDTARRVIGKWLSTASPDDLKKVFLEAIAKADKIAEPLSWMHGAVRRVAPAKPGGIFESDDEHAARVFGQNWGRVRDYAERGFWLPAWGAPPVDPHCAVDPVVLAKFGYRDQALWAKWTEGFHQPAKEGPAA